MGGTGWLADNQQDKLSADEQDKLNASQSEKLQPTRAYLPFPLTFPIVFPASDVLDTNQEDKLTESIRGS